MAREVSRRRAAPAHVLRRRFIFTPVTPPPTARVAAAERSRAESRASSTELKGEAVTFRTCRGVNFLRVRWWPQRDAIKLAIIEVRDFIAR